MQIDRSNYEIWFIDWLDGNLNEIQIERLQGFLQENPDLKEEFDELDRDAMHCISNESFRYKEQLKKTPSDLSLSQFEYLCVAYLENDLSSDQESELKESIEHDQEKRKSFELVQKMKLSHVAVSFKQKSKLFRRTIGQKVIRLSIIGLSAAAITTLVMITYFSAPRTMQVKSEKTALKIEVTSPVQKQPVQTASDKLTSGKKSSTGKNKGKNMFAVAQNITSVSTEHNSYPTVQNDSIVISTENPRIFIGKIPVSDAIGLQKVAIPNTLIAINSKPVIPEYDDGRSKLSRLIAKTFRQKILKENTGKDTPLRVYEIAEAGVSGLNKLLGWEMALDERKDENGDLKSVYFSSKLIKFNAPVKKTEPLP